MPIGILIITPMPAPPFSSAEELGKQVNAFIYKISNENTPETEPRNARHRADAPEIEITGTETGPATLTGLAFFLGFDSLAAFNDYEENGEFASVLKRGRLWVETVYEKKLHHQSSTGAIFALKNMGWGDKSKGANIESKGPLTVEVLVTGPMPAGSEKEVVL